jgi:predicted RNase H-like HicB family nuclease
MSATTNQPQTREFTVRVQHEDDGSYWAEVIELPGCFASGFSMDELIAALSEAISFYLSDDPEAGEIVGAEPTSPPRMQVGEMKVPV